MRISKKFTATLLAAIIAVSSVPATAFADVEGSGVIAVEPGASDVVDPGSTDVVAPGKVTNFKAVTSTDSAKLTWDKVTGATGYEVGLTGSFAKSKSYVSETAITKWTDVEISSDWEANFGTSATNKDLTDVESITFTGNDKATEWTLSYNINNGKYTNVQGNDVAIGTNKEAGFNKAGESVTITDFAPEWGFFKLCFNKAEAGAAITWTLNFKDGHTETKTVGDVAEVTFDGLKAETKYTASIAALNGDVKGEAVTTDATTKAAVATVKNAAKFITVKKGNTVINNGDTVKIGDTLTITVTPNAGYKVVSASVNGKAATRNGTTNNFTYTVAEAGDLNVTAKFAQMAAKVVFNSNYFTVKKGTTALTTGAAVKGGDVLTIDVKVNPGYKVNTVTVGGVAATRKGTTNTFTYKVNKEGDLSIATKYIQMNAKVVFNNKYFTVKKGTTTLTTGAAVKGGDVLTIDVKVNPGYKVNTVTVGGVAATRKGTTNTFTYKVNKEGNLSIATKYIQMNAKVVFNNKYFTVKKGTTTLTTGAAVKGGDVLTIAVKVNPGYKVNTVTVGGVAATRKGTTNTFTYKVNKEGNLAIATKYIQMNAKVAFNSKYFTVKKGTTTLKTGAAVKGGEVLTIAVKVNPGYKVNTVTVGGVAATRKGTTNTFTYKVNKEGNLAIATKYIQKTAKLGAIKSFITVKKGTTVLKANAALKGGDTLTITVKPNTGYKVTSLTINGKVVTATRKGNVFTYKVDVEGTCTVGAKFAKV